METFEDEVPEPTMGRQLGDVLAYARRQKALSLGALARAMGYRNPSRGGQQIQRWERGEKLPPEERLVLLGQVLDLAIMDLLNLRDQDAKERQRDRDRQLALLRRGEAGHRADFKLLERFYHPLMAAFHGSLERPAWTEAQIGDAAIVLAYLGAKAFSLGELLQAWSEEKMTTRCQSCGGRFRLIRLAGSPLSGRHHIDGFCIDCGQSDQRHLIKDGTLLEYSRSQTPRILDHPSQRASAAWLVDLTDYVMESRWSLSQVLAELGETPPIIGLTTPEHQLLATYDAAKAELTLKDHDAPVSFALWFGPDPVPMEEITYLEDDWGEAHSGGRPVIGQLSPPRAGSWRGQTRVFFAAETGEPWHQSRGLLYDPEGRVRGVTDGALPPPVLMWLIRWLAHGQGDP
ncbi:MAG: hypothetical protein CMH55_08060 [Myxococcales bacterium]|nr:hypothetical protein [Myxococcales bacterium]